MENSAVSPSGTTQKSQFRIGSIHGRMHYDRHEQVFHESEAKGKNVHCNVKLVKSAMLASTLNNTPYSINESREQPQYIQNNLTSDYSIGSRNSNTNQPHGIVREMQYTKHGNASWETSDDKARDKLARDKLIQGKVKLMEQQKQEVVSSVRGFTQKQVNGEDGKEGVWCSSTCIDYNKHQQLKGKKKDHSSVGHQSVVSKEEEHMAKLRREREQVRAMAAKKIKEETIARYIAEGRYDEADKLQEVWRNPSTCTGELSKDALDEYLDRIAKGSYAVNKPVGSNNTQMRTNVPRTSQEMVHEALRAGFADGRLVLKKSLKLVKPLPVSTYTRETVPQYKQCKFKYIDGEEENSDLEEQQEMSTISNSSNHIHNISNNNSDGDYY